MELKNATAIFDFFKDFNDLEIYIFAHYFVSLSLSQLSRYKCNKTYIFLYFSSLHKSNSLISKISDGCIRDQGFNPHLHQKLIGILV